MYNEVQDHKFNRFSYYLVTKFFYHEASAEGAFI